MNSKLFAFMFIVVLLIGTVSAADLTSFDNYKRFERQVEEKYGTVEIYDRVLFGPNKKLMDFTLLENTDQCLINCRASGTLTLYETGKPITRTQFKDILGETSILEYKFFIKENVSRQIEEPIYVEECNQIMNNKSQRENVCIDVENGTLTKTIWEEQWVQYYGKDYTPGEYEWRLEAKKDISKSIDWVVTSFGMDLSEFAWWDTDWKKRKPIDLEVFYNVTNSSVFINVTYVADMQDDFQDLRFATNETVPVELDYYLESNISLDTAAIWVRIPDTLIQQTNFTFHMYYDNALATSESDGDEAFLYFDNFTTLDAVKWTNAAGFTIDSGEFLKFPLTDGNTYLSTVFFTNFITTTRFKVVNSLSSNFYGVMGRMDGGAGYVTDYESAQSAILEAPGFGNIDTPATTTTLVPVDVFTYQSSFFIGSNLSSTVNQSNSFNVSTGEMFSGDDTTRTTGRVGFRRGATSANFSLVDFVYVRNYTGIEPLVVFGPQEVTAGVSAVLSEPVDFANITQAAVDLSCNFTADGSTNISNVTVEVYDSSNNLDYTDTDTTPGGATKSFNKTWTTTPLTDDTYNWSCSIIGDDLLTDQTVNRTFILDATLPLINLTAPSGDQGSFIIGNNLSVNWTVSDANLDGCSFEYNNINTTVVCGDNNYSFITVSGQQSLIFYANDTVGNLASNTTNWTYSFLENSQTFNNETIEGSIETFLANITIENSLTVSSTLFIYDGSPNVAESFISGPNNILRMTNFVVPNVAAQEVLSFNFQVTLSDSSVINLSTQTQTVSNISIDDCSDNSFELFNFTLIDEEDQDILLINTSIELAVNVLSIDRTITVASLSNNFNNTNPVVICLNNITGDSSYVVDVTVKYEAQDRVIEYYNIRNSTITNETTRSDIFLFDLLTADNTDFQLTFKGSDFVAVEGALVNLQRQYVSENVFKTVELPITDSNGQTVVHLVRNDVVYNIVVSKDNIVLGTFNNIIAFCEDFTIGNCEINLNAFSSTEEVFDYNEALGISFTPITYNETSRIASVNFLTIDGTTKTINFTISKDDIFGNNSVCSSQVISSGGTLTCTVPTFIDTSPLTAQVFVDGTQSIIDSIYLTTTNISTFGYFIMFLMLLSITMMLLSSKTMTLIGLFVGVGSSMVLTLVEGKVIGSGSSLIWLAIVIIAMIWKLNKGRAE